MSRTNLEIDFSVVSLPWLAIWSGVVFCCVAIGTVTLPQLGWGLMGLCLVAYGMGRALRP